MIPDDVYEGMLLRLKRLDKRTLELIAEREEIKLYDKSSKEAMAERIAGVRKLRDMARKG